VTGDAARARGSGERQILNNLLQAELDGDGEVHGNGFAVQGGGLIFPLTESVHGGQVQHGRAGDNLHGGDAAFGVNERVDFYVAANVLRFGESRVNRRNRLQ